MVYSEAIKSLVFVDFLVGSVVDLGTGGREYWLRSRTLQKVSRPARRPTQLPQNRTGSEYSQGGQ